MSAPRRVFASCLAATMLAAATLTLAACRAAPPPQPGAEGPEAVQFQVQSGTRHYTLRLAPDGRWSLHPRVEPIGLGNRRRTAPAATPAPGPEPLPPERALDRLRNPQQTIYVTSEQGTYYGKVLGLYSLCNAAGFAP